MTWETEPFTVPELEKILAGKKKKYIRYEEGITFYSMGKIPLRELAQDAHALIYLKRVAVINTEILDEYIERYTLLERCGFGPTGWFDKDDFRAIYNFSTPDAVFALGTAVSDMSREVLRNIERMAGRAPGV